MSLTPVFQIFYNDVVSVVWDITSKRRTVCSQDKKDYVEVREVVENIEEVEDKWKQSRDVVQVNLRSRGLDGLRVVKNTRKVLKQLDSMYSGLSISLNEIDQSDIQTQTLVKEEWESKKGQSFDKDILNHQVQFFNRVIGSYRNYPRRVFHLDSSTDELVLGRIYGNAGGIDHLFSYLTPLLKINGDETVEIDIKSCVLQLFVLEKCKGIPNQQDFYDYKKMSEFGLSREDVKFLIQCLLNNEDKGSGRKAFCFGLKKSLNQVKFDQIVNSLLGERPYFRSLFYHPKQTKTIIRVESDFMLSVIEELLNQSIEFLYHFDSIFVKRSEVLKVGGLIKGLSVKRWGREIHLSLSKPV